MKSSKPLILSSLLVAILFALGSRAEACSCVPERPPCEAYGSASAVFVGTVTKSTITTTGNSTSNLYQIKVEEVFLGSVAESIKAWSTDMLCGYEFREGKRYLIYVHRDIKEPYFVTYCSRTRPIEKADEDLRFLRIERQRMNGAQLHGQLLWDTRDFNSLPKGLRNQPPSGIPLILEGQRSRHELTSDKDGKFEASNLKPGIYTIEIASPEGTYVIDGATQKIEINDRGCSAPFFFIGAKQSK